MIGIIIQARMGSSRLYGKVLMPIAGKPLLQYIVDRLKTLKYEVKIIVATTVFSRDDKIEQLCAIQNITCYRGSEDNVLERYYLCAKEYNLEHIIRLTADNPFSDIEELDNLIKLHSSEYVDYSSSINELPKGLGAEIFSFSCLEKSYKNAVSSYEKEHINEYVFNNGDKFNVRNLSVIQEKQRPELSLTIDTENEYKIAVELSKYYNHQFIDTLSIISYLNIFPTESKESVKKNANENID